MNPSRDVVCFGEVLIRLTAPGAELLLQSKRLEVCFGGAEANLAVSLARFGWRAGVASVLPDNALGRAALDELRRYGVDVSGLRFAEGRMGLYFLQPGAVLRPAEITYDRAGSAFAEAPADLIDWDRELAGVQWLHLSGVTPAVGPNSAAAALNAVAAARRQGVKVSFDGNYRAKLWAAWKGDGPAVLKELMSGADLAFVDDRDIALVLGRAFTDEDAAARRRAAAEAAFDAFPHLRRMASTFRTTHGVDHHELSGVMFTRGGGEVRTGSFHLTGVVDRIGGGDAFAAGLMHGLLSGMDDRAALDFGVAAGCLKHAVPGDFNLVGAAEVEALLAGGGLDVRR
ncbi:sugar kinase [Caulobacter sp. 17J80-11]|uniref:PfkB family carbohydrate kinase n=1 Tax=Caulobacter sp. 17J80-11 TaxID=2763502 RepID=UPI00165362DB|nr:sugar kinase [Caulobacter sp. 17J80-11]